MFEGELEQFDTLSRSEQGLPRLSDAEVSTYLLFDVRALTLRKGPHGTRQLEQPRAPQCRWPEAQQQPRPDQENIVVRSLSHRSWPHSPLADPTMSQDTQGSKTCCSPTFLTTTTQVIPVSVVDPEIKCRSKARIYYQRYFLTSRNVCS